MDKKTKVRALEVELKEIIDQQKSLLRRTEALKVQIKTARFFDALYVPLDTLPQISFDVQNPITLQGSVVNNVIELIRRNGREVSNGEILEFLQEKGVDLGDNEPVLLAAILRQEVNKKSARLVRVSRGLYDVRKPLQHHHPAHSAHSEVA
jgi:hypothetical protein